MISAKYRKTITYTILGLVILSLLLCSVVFPPFHGYYTTDENFVADSGVLLWYGNTPRGLDWPAAPHMLFYYLTFGVSCLLATIQNIGNLTGLISVFDIFDLQAYKFLTYREPFILIGRTFQILAVGFILYRTSVILYRQNHELLIEPVKLFLPIIFITSMLVLNTSPVLRPEAISGNLFILLLARMIFSDSLTQKEIVVYSGVFGLILAERLIFAFFVPFFIGAVFLLANRKKFQNAGFSLLMIFITFVIFCPFIITDTLVIMKSFVGGIIAKINDKPMGTFFNREYIGQFLKEPVNIVILILAALGLYAMLRTRKILYFLLIGNTFLFLFLVLRSSLIYDTHVLPAAVVTMFLVGLGLGFVAERINIWGIRIAAVVMIIIATTNIVSSAKYHLRVHKRLNMHDACAWISTLPSETRMLVNLEFEFYVPKSEQCLLREQALNNDNRKMIRKLNYLLGSKAGMEVEGKDLPIIANAFAFEDERQYDSQYKILLKYTPGEKSKVYDYDVYFEAVELASHSIKTDLAFQDFEKGKYEYLVTEKFLKDRKPIKIFDKEWGVQYYVYKRDNY
ncbi:hypothetical protein L0657_09710 [Dyadobacter sp. CY345]|uniref:hypothetical protein n=1 Tax=Dyadobacter sp. CY345 TaxID=2909335 RepID=UPI001F303AA1|nr:hypothetical protein [Dyadobacter sp. CY345]MCF2444233.1 hypothetical protein [Dyadobacter sp. CY345]